MKAPLRALVSQGRPKRLAAAITAVSLLFSLSILIFNVVPAAATLTGSTFDASNGALDAASGLVTGHDAPTGPTDDSFGQGTHEDTAVPTVVDGSIPNNKADLKDFYVALEHSGGMDFLYLGWLREPNPNGSTDMDFEFNQSQVLSANGVTPVRTPGDLLITYDITNGGVSVAVSYRLWDGSNWGAEQSLAGNFEGSFNTIGVAPHTEHTFGEAAINLTDSGLFPANACIHFGSVYLKSRSSPSFESELKDFIAPQPLNVSNCGTLIVRKDTVPDSSTDFTFTTTGAGLPASFNLDDDSNGALPNNRTFVNLIPGSYSVTETADSNYNLSGISCDGTGQRVGTTAQAAITITAGNTVDCKWTNTAKPSHLNVIKHVVNDNGGEATAGDFSMHVSGASPSPATFPGADAPGTSVTLGAGAYNVTETEHSDYQASYSADCSGTIAINATKTCTITNDDSPPGLTVIKHVINDNGGSKVAGDFTIHVSAEGTDPAPFPGNENGTALVIRAGAYAVSEDNLAGYASSLSPGCSGTIALGAQRVCTITNNDIQPRLTVIKHVINNNGGDLQAGDFTANVTATGPDPAPFAGSESGTEMGINAGPYNVLEDSSQGYVGSYSTGCDGIVGIGQTRTCTITNNDAPPGLTVVKHVINDNGGTKVAADFLMHVTAAGDDPAPFAGSEIGTHMGIDAGAYSVVEDNLAGYAATLSAECSGTVALGAEKVCTITNDDIQPRLTVIKHVINDNGGDLQAGDFTMSVVVPGPDPAPFPGSEQGVELGVTAGAYHVTEGEMAGYAASYSGGCDGSVALGQSKTCTITNDDIQPRLTVIKHVVNNSGGDLVAGDFTMNVTATGVDPAPFAGSESGTGLRIDAGSYSVVEDSAPGYAGSYSAECEGVMAVGDNKTCTVTNNDAPAGLTVIKHVINDNGGTKVAGDFLMRVTATGDDPAPFAGNEEGTHSIIDAGPYSVSEDQLPGYTSSLSEDCSGTISLGAQRVCTITNNDIQPKLTVVKHVINDNGGALSAGDFTMNVSATGTDPDPFPGNESGTQSGIDAGSYSVDESRVAGYVGTLSSDCEGAVGVGETKTCTITNNDAPPGLTVVKHVINDNGGAKVAADFLITVTATGPDPAPFAGSELGTRLAVNAGEYSVAEAQLAGYQATLSAECSGSIALGAARVCTITNDDIQPVLTVVKHVINDDGGTKTASAFTLAVAGSAVAVTFPGSEAGTQVPVNAGSYAVTETDLAGYAKTLSADCTGSISIGERKACTVTNNDVVQVLGVEINRPASPPEAPLPQTGIDAELLVALGLFLLVCGGNFLLLGYRRQLKG